MVTISVVIPHYWAERRVNIPQVVAALREGECIPDEIIIWNNEEPFKINEPSTYVVQSPFNLGCKARFLGAMVARSEYILFMDNDVFVKRHTLRDLQHWAGKLEGIVSFCGRQLTEGMSYFDGRSLVSGHLLIAPTAVDVAMGQCELVKKSVVNKMLGDLPFEATNVNDDMWFSVVAKEHGIMRWVVPFVAGESGFEVRDRGVGMVFNPKSFLPERDELCQRYFR